MKNQKQAGRFLVLALLGMSACTSRGSEVHVTRVPSDSQPENSPDDTVPPPPPVPPPPEEGVLRTHILFGAAAPDLAALEQSLGYHLDIASEFVDWSYVFGGAKDVASAEAGKRQLLFSWEPNDIRFSSIVNGDYDGYLDQVAKSVAAFPYDIYVRPWAEMNGDWSTWQPTANGDKPSGGTPSEFIAAWRYLVTFFRSRDVNNMKFVFNPDASNRGITPLAEIWPGQAYVDVLGIDGYNWGISSATGDTWQEFDSIFAEMYGLLTSLHPTAPVWVCEFGSKEPMSADGAPVDSTHSKGQWLHNLMQLSTYPRIVALAYFNKQKERDWRLESSADSLDAIRNELAQIKRSP